MNGLNVDLYVHKVNFSQYNIVYLYIVTELQYTGCYSITACIFCWWHTLCTHISSLASIWMNCCICIGNWMCCSDS